MWMHDRTWFIALAYGSTISLCGNKFLCFIFHLTKFDDNPLLALSKMPPTCWKAFDVWILKQAEFCMNLFTLKIHLPTSCPFCLAPNHRFELRHRWPFRTPKLLQPGQIWQQRNATWNQFQIQPPELVRKLVGIEP